MHRRLITFATLVALTLVACAESPPTTPSNPPTAATSAALPSGVTTSCPFKGGELTVRVGPLVRLDADTSALPVSVSGTAHAWLDTVWNAGYGTELRARGLRLVDFDAGVALESTGASSDRLEVSPGTDLATTVFYGPLAAARYTVLLPLCGYALDVPVVGADAAGSAIVTALTAARGRASITPSLGSPAELATYITAADESVEARTTTKDVTVTLAADVLFDFDSDTLTTRADASLAQLGKQLTELGGGALTIVGHTDDVGSASYNLDLSKRRAAAVHRRLGQLASLASYQVSVDGKGKDQPRAVGTSEQARAANRRVELTITPSKPPAEAVGAGDGSSASPPTGPSATGAKGVELSLGGGQAGKIGVALTHVVKRGRYLLGLVTVTGGTPAGPPVAQWFSPKRLTESARGEEAGDAYWATTGFTLLRGGQRIHPADYLSPRQRVHTPLTELKAADVLAAGEKQHITVIWPDLGGDTVTLDQLADPPGLVNAPFRLTDIPLR